MGGNFYPVKWMVRALTALLFLAMIGFSVGANDTPLPLPQAPDGSPSGVQVQSVEASSSGAFKLVYPSMARPVAITRKFVKPKPNKTPHEGVDLYAPAGTQIQAGAAGIVKKIVSPANDKHGYGGFIKIKTVHNGIKYKVLYGNLGAVYVSVGQGVNAGDLIGQSAGESIKIVIQTNSGGMSGFRIKNIANPKKLLDLPGLRVRSNVQNLRLRAAPSTEAEILGTVNPWQLLKTPLKDYQAILRMGKDDKWFPVKLNNGKTAYVAAWFVDVVSKNDPGVKLDAPVRGLNIDPYAMNGLPDPLALANVGWVRINYNVSFDPIYGSYGNTDLNAAYNRYHPIIKQYADSGTRVILVFTHQLFGEGQGYNWATMDSAQWATFTAQYVAYVQAVAGQYTNQGLVYAYQIWNEQDAPVGSQSAVSMPSHSYANLLSGAIQAIRAVDGKAVVLTGGHTGGPVKGVEYARATLSALPGGVLPDGIAVHPYGRGPAGSPFSIFGTINESINAWSTVMPGKPLWITEWGVLDLHGDDAYAQAVTDHAMGFLHIVEQTYKGAVASAAWYGWADGMDNGYGLIRANGSTREPLYSQYLQLNQFVRAYG